MKLMRGVDFINFLCTNFSYEHHFGSFFSSYMYVVKAAEMTLVQKPARINVEESDKRCLFHQHFTYKFFIQMSFLQHFSSYMYVVKAAEMTLVWKTRTYNVDEIDGRRCTNASKNSWAHLTIPNHCTVWSRNSLSLQEWKNKFWVFFSKTN